MRISKPTLTAGVIALGCVLAASYRTGDAKDAEAPLIQQRSAMGHRHEMTHPDLPEFEPEEPPFDWEEFHREALDVCRDVFTDSKHWDCDRISANGAVDATSSTENCLEGEYTECFAPFQLVCKYVFGEQVLDRVFVYVGPVTFLNDVLNEGERSPYLFVSGQSSKIRLSKGFLYAGEPNLASPSTLDYDFLYADAASEDVRPFCDTLKGKAEEKNNEGAVICDQISMQLEAFARAGHPVDNHDVCANTLSSPVSISFTVERGGQKMMCSYISEYSSRYGENRWVLSCHPQFHFGSCDGMSLELRDNTVVDVNSYLDDLEDCADQIRYSTWDEIPFNFTY